ncbi:MAG TPA: DUF4440 domain-containing protein [Caulobacteraceae bacterium]
MRAVPMACWMILAAATFGCDPTPPPGKPVVDTAKIVDAIKTDEVHWNADWQAHDAAKIASHYAPGAILMISGASVATGHAAIQSALSQALADPAFSVSFASDKVDVGSAGDLAATRGNYKLTSTDPKTKTVITTTGAYVTVYKPQKDGAWKAIWDINAPGPATSLGAAMAGTPTAKAAQ